MKTFFLSLLCSLSVFGFLPFRKAMAQSLPAFKMTATNGKTYTNTSFSSKKPIVLIYFAPDCEHCQALTKQLLRNVSAFKNAQVIMVSFEPLQDVSIFQKDYGLNKYPNILMGTEEPALFFKNYYNLQHTPFTALFDKNKKLVVSYKDSTPLSDLIKNLQKVEKTER